MKKVFPYTIFPLGDSALVLEFGDEIDVELNQHIHHIVNKIKNENLHYVTDVVPAYATLTVFYNVLQVPYEREMSSFEIVAEKLKVILEDITSVESLNEKVVIEIPVCYSLKYGIDLPEVAGRNDMDVDKIIAIHSKNVYHVFMIGFLPGFAYMGEVDASIATPRRSTPRKEVAAGSVGIAGKQTGIYPFSSPGGWNIIGRTPIQLFKKNSELMVLLQPGDKIKFIPITEDEYKSY